MVTFAPRLTTESQQTSGMSEKEEKKKNFKFFQEKLARIKKMITFATPKRLKGKQKEGQRFAFKIER